MLLISWVYLILNSVARLEDMPGLERGIALSENSDIYCWSHPQTHSFPEYSHAGTWVSHCTYGTVCFCFSVPCCIIKSKALIFRCYSKLFCLLLTNDCQAAQGHLCWFYSNLDKGKHLKACKSHIHPAIRNFILIVWFSVCLSKKKITKRWNAWEKIRKMCVLLNKGRYCIIYVFRSKHNWSCVDLFVVMDAWNNLPGYFIIKVCDSEGGMVLLPYQGFSRVADSILSSALYLWGVSGEQGFPSTSHKHASRWPGCTKLPPRHEWRWIVSLLAGEISPTYRQNRAL